MDNKERYFSIFENLKKEHSTHIPENSNSNILIIDFLNTFIRSYCGSPALNNNGEHVGGVTGFLYSIGTAIRMFEPTRCILVSDGVNSAARKRKIYPEYKEKRSVKFSVNRQYDFKNETEEKKAMHLQMQMLLGYLEYMPIQLVTVDATEADDTVAYLVQDMFCKNENKVIIMSSDKDFLQLVDDRINVWSPTKKKLYTPKSILDEYGIHPNNFLFYRTLDGDKSDNIPGVNAVGLKTLQKNMPFLAEEKRTNINEIIEFSTKRNEGKKKLKFYENIINSKDILEMNESLMNLKAPNISESNKANIRHQIDKKIPLLNKTKLLTMYIHDGLSNAMNDFSGWILQTLTKLNSYANTKTGEN
jgi:DNA polymerase-1